MTARGYIFDCICARMFSKNGLKFLKLYIFDFFVNFLVVFATFCHCPTTILLAIFKCSLCKFRSETTFLWGLRKRIRQIITHLVTFYLELIWPIKTILSLRLVLAENFLANTGFEVFVKPFFPTVVCGFCGSLIVSYMSSTFFRWE